MSSKLKAALKLVTLAGMTPKEFNCPKGYQALPEEGWKEKTYYVVEVAFSENNPVHRGIFYSGFLHKAQPGGYNAFAMFVESERSLKITDAYFIKVIREIDIDSIDD
ncbi:MAG TPA: hypothetical protein VI911_06940 [Patescibacteria group bacterium]|nr:hypothetical protein [Patescibacteria group bacterium]